MKDNKKVTIVKQLRNVVAEIDKISKAARRSHKSLSGDNYYGNKFDELRSNLIKTMRELESIVENTAHSSSKQAFKLIKLHFDLLVNPDTPPNDRSSAKKQLLFILRSQIEPFIENGKISKIPITDTIIPMAIVKGTRGYIEKIALQANGCYELGWFDACAVMIRRLVETLIIECFEYHKIDAKIKDVNENYFHLKYLIDICLKEKIWTLSRNTKTLLPKLKDIGDLSAHNRRYLATKSDIDKIRDGVRIVTEELVYLSKLIN